MMTPITFAEDGSDNPNKGLGILKVNETGLRVRDHFELDCACISSLIVPASHFEPTRDHFELDGACLF
jgi:hypothetical protein